MSYHLPLLYAQVGERWYALDITTYRLVGEGEAHTTVLTLIPSNDPESTAIGGKTRVLKVESASDLVDELLGGDDIDRLAVADFVEDQT